MVLKCDVSRGVLAEKKAASKRITHDNSLIDVPS